jgi:hypothetical protein
LHRSSNSYQARTFDQESGVIINALTISHKTPKKEKTLLHHEANSEKVLLAILHTNRFRRVAANEAWVWERNKSYEEYLNAFGKERKFLDKGIWRRATIPYLQEVTGLSQYYIEEAVKVLVTKGWVKKAYAATPKMRMDGRGRKKRQDRALHYLVSKKAVNRTLKPQGRKLVSFPVRSKKGRFVWKIVSSPRSKNLRCEVCALKHTSGAKRSERTRDLEKKQHPVGILKVPSVGGGSPSAPTGVSFSSSSGFHSRFHAGSQAADTEAFKDKIIYAGKIRAQWRKCYRWVESERFNNAFDVAVIYAKKNPVKNFRSLLYIAIKGCWVKNTAPTEEMIAKRMEENRRYAQNLGLEIHNHSYTGKDVAFRNHAKENQVCCELDAHPVVFAKKFTEVHGPKASEQKQTALPPVDSQKADWFESLPWGPFSKISDEQIAEGTQLDAQRMKAILKAQREGDASDLTHPFDIEWARILKVS